MLCFEGFLVRALTLQFPFVVFHDDFKQCSLEARLSNEKVECF
jgi:hypothetical protein